MQCSVKKVVRAEDAGSAEIFLRTSATNRWQILRITGRGYVNNLVAERTISALFAGSARNKEALARIKSGPTWGGI